MTLIDQHQSNTRSQAQTVVADHKYGTAENFVACQERGITTHLGDALGKAQHGRERTIVRAGGGSGVNKSRIT